MANIKYPKLHIFNARNPLASFDAEEQNVARLSLTFGEGDEEKRHVFLLSRSDMEGLGLQIRQLFEPEQPPTPYRKGRRS
jgi:hypothetical protein